MKKLPAILIFVMVTFFLLLAFCHSEEKKIKIDHQLLWKDSVTDEEKADKLLKIMTLEEKAGQLSQFTSDWEITGPSIRKNYIEDIRQGKVGSVFNAYTAKYVRYLQEIAVNQTRCAIPLLFGYDIIHGHKTIFPIPLAESCSWDLAMIEQDARIAATEGSAEGINWTFAPMVDIARDPRWGRISEGAGEDPYLASLIAVSRVKGFQGENLAAPNSLLACAKHFAAYGAAQAGRDYNTVDISLRELFNIYLSPFYAAEKAGVATFMSAFNDLSGIPCTGNYFLLYDVLRKRWGFNGFVVSDYTSINELVNHGIAANEKEAALLSFKAGLDMDMQGSVYNKYLPELVREGKISEDEIDISVKRILLMKFKKGLFDNPFYYCDEKREKENIMTEDFLLTARESAKRSIVLLKNENQLLPLKKDIRTIALIGPLADDKRSLIGSWSAAGNWKKCVSVFEGIKRKASPKTKILYEKGCEITGSDTKGFKKAIDAAKRSDIVIAVVGESWDMSGEAASRSSLDIPGVQKKLLWELKRTGKPIVMILMNARPLTINWEKENMNSILETWFLGTQAGNAIADVVFGDYNPSGKLTVTFPRNTGQIPIYYNCKNTGRPFDASNKYTSKYLDCDNTPLFPFGFGLSYTTFKYSPIVLNKTRIGLNDTLNATVNITNTGSYDGEEVVQLYIRDIAASLTRPVKELKGFKKIFIPKAATVTVCFEITANDLAFYNAKLNYVAEEGDFKLFIGTNSYDFKETSFKLTESGTMSE